MPNAVDSCSPVCNRRTTSSSSSDSDVWYTPPQMPTSNNNAREVEVICLSDDEDDNASTKKQQKSRCILNNPNRSVRQANVDSNPRRRNGKQGPVRRQNQNQNSVNNNNSNAEPIIISISDDDDDDILINDHAARKQENKNRNTSTTPTTASDGNETYEGVIEFWDSVRRQSSEKGKLSDSELQRYNRLLRRAEIAEKKNNLRAAESSLLEAIEIFDGDKPVVLRLLALSVNNGSVLQSDFGGNESAQPQQHSEIVL